MKQTEAGLREIEAFLRGDPAVVEAIRAAVAAVVRGFQGPGREADRDLVQEVMGRLVRNLAANHFRGEASLKTYAQRVAKYACLEQIRRRRLEVRIDFEAVPSDALWSEPEGTLLRREEHLRNLRAFASLSAGTRELLRLIFVEGMSYAEVADRLGVTEGAIKSRVHRARGECRDATMPRPAARRRDGDETER
jgi:RNA polymerase sigma-70 factor (ECF subfamily)